jgi:hypothetical protein
MTPRNSKPLLLLAAAAFPSFALTLISVTAKGTFENAGIRVAYTGDADSNASVTVEYRKKGDAAWRTGHPLIRIAGARFVTSLFWLTEGTTYEARLVPVDPEGATVSFAQPFEITTRSSSVTTNGSDIYVDADAAAGGNGAQSTPYATIQQAANAAQAGDVIHIMPGTYREQVTPPRSGNQAAWIRFKGEGAGVIMDGSETIPTNSGWTSQGNGVYSRAYSRTPAFGTLDSVRLYNHGNLDSLRSNGDGIAGGFCVQGGTLYVKAPDGNPLINRELRMAICDYGYYIDGKGYIIIENLDIGYYNAMCVRIRDSHHCTVSRCTIHQSREMVSIDRLLSTDNLVEYCSIWGTGVTAWPWDICHDSHDCGSNCIAVSNAGEGNVVRHNTCRGTYNGIYLGQWTTSYPEENALENDVYGNTLSEIVDDGLEPECKAINLRMYRNTFHNVYSPISLAPIETGPTWVMFNVIANTWVNSPGAAYWGGSPGWVKISLTPSGARPLGAMRIYHNTAFLDAPDNNGWDSPGSGYTHFKNNIVFCTRYVFENTESAAYPPGNEWDYNNFYTTAADRYVKWENVRLTEADFQAKGFQVHGISQPPHFADTAGGDFHPRSDDPGINRGVPLPGINDGFAGAAPDMGAFEYGAASASCPARSNTRASSRDLLRIVVFGDGRLFRPPATAAGRPELFGIDGRRLFLRNAGMQPAAGVILARMPGPAGNVRHP